MTKKAKVPEVGYLYCVVYTQGTVKVGCTYNLEARLPAHRNVGRKFGVYVVEEISEAFDGSRILMLERILCRYCADHAKSADGHEWFWFSSVDEALSKTKEFLAKLKAGDFGRFGDRGYMYIGDSVTRKHKDAIRMILDGMDVNEAAEKVNVRPESIMALNIYKRLFKAMGERK